MRCVIDIITRQRVDDHAFLEASYSEQGLYELLEMEKQRKADTGEFRKFLKETYERTSA